MSRNMTITAVYVLGVVLMDIAIEKERLRRSSYGLIPLKNKEFSVYYSRVELLHTNPELLTTISVFKRWIRLRGPATVLMLMHRSTPGHGYGVM
jgi:hypothetical protein